ncbi:MAG: type IVB secretion system coupling complex protein DotM/IcmP, partial [Firmicutes bacterium]|nr:type IVB secretion system coupling complex protein DotM/IcmP [Bacillota bacterium]
MPPPPQQPSGQSDDSMGILWAIAAIFAACAAVWYLFKKQLVAFFIKIKLAEISLISYFTPALADVRTTILAADPEKMTFLDVSQIASVVGVYLRYPVILVLLIFAALVFFGSSVRIYKNIYTMRDLLKLEKDNWPQITPVVHLDLIKTDIDKGPWAMAMTPMQFCKRYNLVEERRRTPTEGMTRKERVQVEAILKRGAASKIFIVQLGPVFENINKLPLHTRALFSIFAARINNDTQSAQSL